jgi:hypothetical protein
MIEDVINHSLWAQIGGIGQRPLNDRVQCGGTARAAPPLRVCCIQRFGIAFTSAELDFAPMTSLFQ